MKTVDAWGWLTDQITNVPTDLEVKHWYVQIHFTNLRTSEMIDLLEAVKQGALLGYGSLRFECSSAWPDARWVYDIKRLCDEAPVSCVFVHPVSVEYRSNFKQGTTFECGLHAGFWKPSHHESIDWVGLAHQLDEELDDAG